MRISLVTPRGEADLDIDVADDYSLADLVHSVSGLAPPPLVEVDGRPQPGNTPLLAAGVTNGTLIVSPAPVLDATGAVKAVLSQVAGPGSGAQRPLAAGRYALGPARQATIAHLGFGEAPQPMATISVTDAGVRVESAHGRLDGAAAADERPWNTECLDVAGRVFRIDHAAHTPLVRPSAHQPFVRQPRAQSNTAATPDNTAATPDNTAATPIDALATINQLSPRLWERRLDHHDALRVSVGLTDVTPSHGPVHTPVDIDLMANRAVGIVGPPRRARAVARSMIVELCALHGPADLGFVVISSADRRDRWDWVKWLPYGESAGPVQVLDDLEQLEPLIHASAATPADQRAATVPAHVTVVVVDDASRWGERGSPLRRLMALPWAPVRLLTIAEQSADLPAVCSAIIDLNESPTVELITERQRHHGIRPYQLDVDLARRAAMMLAGVIDSELPPEPDSALPTSLSLLAHLDLRAIDGGDLVPRWKANSAVDHLVAELGVTTSGVLRFDMVNDGPHALIAGSPNSGKSELLQTMVASLAINASPDDVNVLFIDVDGGPGGAALAGLPHTVGVVDTLDEHLAARLLRSLSAELHRREMTLHQANAMSLAEYRELDGVTPLPRLLIMIDELAVLSASLPTFMSSLVDLTQRGRTLGLHLLVATRRPTTALDNKIKANTNLRLALRLNDDLDSVDVLGSGDAARITRQTPGRGFARLGTGAVVGFQTAEVGGRTPSLGDAPSAVVQPFVMSRPPTPLEERCARARSAGRGHTDLQRIVIAAQEAATAVGCAAPHRPVQPPLPPHVPSADFVTLHGNGAFALEDLPDEQRTRPRRWNPVDDGSMVVYGVAGAGTTSALLSLANSISHGLTAADLQIVAVDADSWRLRTLAALDTCRVAVRATDHDAMQQLAAELADEMERRAAERRRRPPMVIVVDNAGALYDHTNEAGRDRVMGAVLARIITEGPSLGMYALVSARHATALTPDLASMIPNELVMRLDDAHEYAGFGLRASEIPQFVPGRALDPHTGIEMQIIEPPAELAAAPGAPPTVNAVETHLQPAAALHAASTLSDTQWQLGVATDAHTGAPALLPFRPGERGVLLSASPAQRAALLRHVAATPCLADAGVRRLLLADEPQPWAAADGVEWFGAGQVAAFVSEVVHGHTPRLAMVADAHHRSRDELAELLGERDDVLIVVATGDIAAADEGFLGALLGDEPEVLALVDPSPEALRRLGLDDVAVAAPRGAVGGLIVGGGAQVAVLFDGEPR
jgi:DNA segregation ATPase FtsK/SpoIIIE, S-DNA-T family